MPHRYIEDFEGKLVRGEIKRSDKYDAYYDTKTGEWLERACSDEDCQYCSERPLKAF